jgi:hypothetical protein
MTLGSAAPAIFAAAISNITMAVKTMLILIIAPALMGSVIVLLVARSFIDRARSAMPNVRSRTAVKSRSANDRLLARTNK